MNAFHFKVKDTDDFLMNLKIEATRNRKSMKTFVIEAVKEKLERLEKDKGGSATRGSPNRVDTTHPQACTRTI